MTGYLRLFLFMSAFSLFFAHADAQPAAGATTLSDTAASRMATWNAIEVYHRFMGEGSRLFNGPEHIGYLPFHSGHPYFQIDSVQTGSVRYEDAWYRDVPLLYDIVRDELITPNLYGEPISLSNEKVNEFYLLGHHFIKTAGEYYDLLCSGKIILEVRRAKRIQESIELMQVIRDIQYTDHYYILKDGERYSIGNLRSLLALVKDKKKEINQDLRRKKIKYRRDHEQALVEAVTYYNQTFPQ
jgi:hypothetical protein